MTDRERVYKLVNKVCEYATWALELKQENSELKQRVAELEKSKKKRKFRAMTNGEYCKKWLSKHNIVCFLTEQSVAHYSPLKLVRKIMLMSLL